MTWQLTDDVHAFARQARGLLLVDPVRQTLPLTILDWLLSGRTYSDEPPLFAWWTGDSGEVTGCVLMTPPYELQIAVLPHEAVTPLTDTLLAREVAVPGARLASPSAEEFARQWTEVTGSEAEEVVRLRLHALGTFTPPSPPPPGYGGPARVDESETIARWWRAYLAEVEAHRDVDARPLAMAAVHDGLMSVWRGADGAAVSMAARKPATGGAARIGPVYTPPELRGRGYAGAVTAAATQAAIDDGAEHVLLFTDLANPVSNKVYARIGFRALGDSRTVAFLRR